VWVKVRRDALSLTDRDITTATWGPELRAQHGASGGSFPSHTLPVRAVDGQREREREREREIDRNRDKGYFVTFYSICLHRIDRNVSFSLPASVETNVVT